MPYLPGSKFDQEKLRVINEEFLRQQRLAELRVKTFQQKELCFLALAGALLRLVHDLGYTWEEVALYVHGVADRGHAWRIAHRKIGVSKTPYENMTDSINACLSARGFETIQFPVFPNSN